MTDGAACDLFRRHRPSNQYDRLVIDVPALYRQYPLAERAQWARAPRRSSRYSRGLPLGGRYRLWQLLHRLRLDQQWFTAFAAYWHDVLGGRPLQSPDDFHFLRGVYRLRHQDNEVPDTEDPHLHLAAWQQPELLYQVFVQVYLESLAPRLISARWLKRLAVQRYCEFGCATAPVTVAYHTFFGDRVGAHLLDLPTVSLHYAAFRFAHIPSVVVEALDANRRFMPPSDLRVDAIVCTTVLEHLLEPLRIVQRFADMLTSRGALIFDYLATKGAGLDSHAGMRDREAVLAFIAERFEVVWLEGRALGDGLAVVRRR